MEVDDDFVFQGPHERGVWSQEEHDKFLAAVALHPNGPWRTIAALVGTRSVRQVQTHAQKYHEKVNRRARGLQKNRLKVSRLEHRVDDAAQNFLERPRGGKGHKRGKYNKRNRDVRVAPIPPRPRVSLPIPPPSTAPVPEAQPSHSITSENETPSPTMGNDKEEKPAVPLPSATAVSLSDSIKSPPLETVLPPPSDLMLDTDELFSLTDTTSESYDDSRPPTPSVLLPPSSPLADLSSETLETLLYDDIIAVEEAPEHALSVGDVPSLNDALDYFLRVMTGWGPTATSGAHPHR